jgi:hypothetical protein
MRMQEEGGAAPRFRDGLGLCIPVCLYLYAPRLHPCTCALRRAECKRRIRAYFSIAHLTH